MTSLQLFACIGMIAGSFILLRLSPAEFAGAIFGRMTERPKSIRDEINESAGRKKPSILRREIAEAQNILELTGRSGRFSLICASSLLLFAVGASIAILLQNVFLVPVLAVGFLFLPFWYTRLMAGHYKKEIAAELETALSIITTAYLRNEDILTAVEENIQYLNQPVQNVFIDFLSHVKHISPDMDAALKTLRGRIENGVFHEWCDAVCACQHDRSLKSTLPSIVGKLSDTRVVNGELENMVFEPRKEFITMVILVVGNVPLVYLLNKSWYDTLMHTTLGRFILAVTAAVILISAARVIRLTKPVEYRR